MSNILSAGFTFALLSADSYSMTATKPMTMASQELKKREPDLALVKRTMSYGTQELDKANKSANLASEELKKAQEEAAAKKKAEDAARLEEKRQENKLENEKLQESVGSGNIGSGDVTTESVGSADAVVGPESAGSVDGTTTTPPVITDSVEISVEVLKQAATTAPTSIKVATDVAKTYSPAKVATAVSFAPTVHKIDVFG